MEKLIYDLDENDRKIFGNVKRNPNNLIIAINGTFQDLNICLLEGDEFAILLPSTTAEQAQDFYDRIKKTCEEDNIKPIYLRPSIALGHVTQKGEYQDTKTLLKEVDKRMYQDKNITR